MSTSSSDTNQVIGRVRSKEVNRDIGRLDETLRCQKIINAELKQLRIELETRCKIADQVNNKEITFTDEAIKKFDDDVEYLYAQREQTARVWNLLYKES